MSIAKPFTFTANTYAKASEVNADFDIVYSQVNTNISAIAQNATDIDNLENNKADINGSTSQRFAVADAISNGDAINKQTLFKAIGNSIDYISGLTITKDSGSPEDTIIVSAGSAYDSTKTVVLSLDSSTSKQNLNQAASATYYVYIIGNSTGSLIDILISTSSTTPALPTGYSLFRQIGYYTTNSDNEIDSISYYGEGLNSDKSAYGIMSAVIPDWDSGVSIALRTSGTIYQVTQPGVIILFRNPQDGAYEIRLYKGTNDSGVLIQEFAAAGQFNTGYSYSYNYVDAGSYFIKTNNTTVCSAKFYPSKGVANA